MAKMEILESALLREFIRYIKSTWSAQSKVDQRRRRLRQLVSKVRAVVDAAEGGAGAGVRDESFSAWLQVLRSEAMRGQEVLDAPARAVAVAGVARRFLNGFKALFVCSAEVDRLTDAVEQLELLAGPRGDLDMFVRVLSMDAAKAAAATEEDNMDVDGRPAAPGARYHRQLEGSGCSCGCAGTVTALLPSPGAKRKRAFGGDGGSTSRGEVDAVQPQKRRNLAWTRSHQRSQSGFGRVSFAPRGPPAAAALPPSRRARTVALAMARIQRRIGNPTTTTTSHRREPSLGRQFSRITL